MKTKNIANLRLASLQSSKPEARRTIVTKARTKDKRSTDYLNLLVADYTCIFILNLL